MADDASTNDKPVTSDNGDTKKGDGDKPSDADKAPELKYSQDDMNNITNTVRANAEKKAEEKAETERKEAEQKQLEEQGKWKEAHDKKEEELAKLRADKARADFLDSARGALKEMELASFDDLLLAPVADVEDVKTKAAKLQEMIDAEVAKRVDEKLKTPPVVKPGDTPPPSAQGTIVYPSMKDG